VIAFLVSLGALLFAAAGLAYHIWLQHRKLRRKLSADAGAAYDPADEIKVDLEH
jgi:hypothetical protein